MLTALESLALFLDVPAAEAGRGVPTKNSAMGWQEIETQKA